MGPCVDETAAGGLHRPLPSRASPPVDAGRHHRCRSMRAAAEVEELAEVDVGRSPSTSTFVAASSRRRGRSSRGRRLCDRGKLRRGPWRGWGRPVPPRRRGLLPVRICRGHRLLAASGKEEVVALTCSPRRERGEGSSIRAAAVRGWEGEREVRSGRICAGTERRWRNSARHGEGEARVGEEPRREWGRRWEGEARVREETGGWVQRASWGGAVGMRQPRVCATGRAACILQRPLQIPLELLQWPLLSHFADADQFAHSAGVSITICSTSKSALALASHKIKFS
jgi:hypothetical protein